MRYGRKKRSDGEAVGKRVGQRIISRWNYYSRTPLCRKLLARALRCEKKNLLRSTNSLYNTFQLKFQWKFLFCRRLH